jgi:hypothetical protein
MVCEVARRGRHAKPLRHRPRPPSAHRVTSRSSTSREKMAPPSSGGAGPGAGESDRGAARASVGAASERAQSSSSECAAMPGIAAGGREAAGVAERGRRRLASLSRRDAPCCDDGRRRRRGRRVRQVSREWVLGRGARARPLAPRRRPIWQRPRLPALFSHQVRPGRQAALPQMLGAGPAARAGLLLLARLFQGKVEAVGGGVGAGGGARGRATCRGTPTRGSEGEKEASGSPIP